MCFVLAEELGMPAPLSRLTDGGRSQGVEGSQVEAFGKALPVATSDTPEGREQNWRVEVWLH